MESLADILQFRRRRAADLGVFGSLTIGGAVPPRTARAQTFPGFCAPTHRACDHVALSCRPVAARPSPPLPTVGVRRIAVRHSSENRGEASGCSGYERFTARSGLRSAHRSLGAEHRTSSASFYGVSPIERTSEEAAPRQSRAV